MPTVEVPHSALDGYRWIAQMQIPATEGSLLVQLMRRVSSKTWRWPPKAGEAGGSSVRELAHAIGRSERHTRRLLRALEARGVLRTVDRRPVCSEYQLVPEQMQRLGEQGLESERFARLRHRQQVQEARERADAVLDQVEAAPGVRAAAKATGRKAAAGGKGPVEGLPAWAQGPRVAKRGVTAEQAAGLVRAVWVAAGSKGSWLHEGTILRATLRRWEQLGRPPDEEWAKLLGAVAGAWRAGLLNRFVPRNLSFGTAGLLTALGSSDVRTTAGQVLEAQPAEPPVEAAGPLEPLCFRLPAPADAGPTPRVSDAASWEAALDAHIAEQGDRGESLRALLVGVCFGAVDQGEVVLGVPWGTEKGCTMVTQLIGEDLLPRLVGAPVRLVHA